MAEQAGPGLDTSRPHPARVYDYLLGGKSNFAADRALAQKMLQEAPDLRIAARENRAFLGGAVQYLAGEAGVRQFLDIGTGLPTADNVHEVAQRIAPESRVVYADNDPMVVAHARALLASAPEGRTAYVHADLRDPAQIVADPQVRDVLDFDRPVALVLLAACISSRMRTSRQRSWLPSSTRCRPAATSSPRTPVDHAPAPVAAMERAAQAGGIRTQQRDSGDFARWRSRAWACPPGRRPRLRVAPRRQRVRPDPPQVNVYCGVARSSLYRGCTAGSWRLSDVRPGGGGHLPPATDAGSAVVSDNQSQSWSASSSRRTVPSPGPYLELTVRSIHRASQSPPPSATTAKSLT